MNNYNYLLVLLVIVFVLIVGYNPNNSNNLVTNSTIITGLVIDKSSKEILVGVKVTIADSGLSTYTNFEGEFFFRDMNPGKYKIMLSYPSYKKKIVTLNSTAINLKPIELELIK